MTITSIAVYALLIGWLVAKRMTGRPVGTPKKLLVLPAVLVVLGLQQAAHGHLDGVDVAVAVLGSAMALAFGAWRGAADQLSVRDGYQWVRWTPTSLVTFVAYVAIKLLLDLGSVVIGGTTAGASATLLLAFGLGLLGEALVILARSHHNDAPLAPVR